MYLFLLRSTSLKQGFIWTEMFIWQHHLSLSGTISIVDADMQLCVRVQVDLFGIKAVALAQELGGF